MICNFVDCGEGVAGYFGVVVYMRCCGGVVTGGVVVEETWKVAVERYWRKVGVQEVGNVELTQKAYVVVWSSSHMVATVFQ